MTLACAGPEDPKLLLNPQGSLHGEWALAFSSLPPAAHRPDCQNKGEAVKQMYFAASASTSTSASAAPAVRLDCGFTRRHEKNWIAFYRGDQVSLSRARSSVRMWVLCCGWVGGSMVKSACVHVRGCCTRRG